MRKKNILVLVEHIMWGIIILLPLLYWLISPLGYAIGGGSEGTYTMPSLGNILMNTLHISNSQSNPIYKVFNDMFNTGGVLPFFTSGSSTLLYFVYFVVVEVMHLVVDVILFIPRLAHKWMSKFTNEEVIDNG